MAEWQYRKFYGRSGLTDAEGWAPWADVEEGVDYYSPRTLLQDLDALGKIEFRIKPALEVWVGYDSAPMPTRNTSEEEAWNEWLNDHPDELDDPWPDFHDEYDIYGGEPPR